MKLSRNKCFITRKLVPFMSKPMLNVQLHKQENPPPPHNGADTLLSGEKPSVENIQLFYQDG